MTSYSYPCACRQKQIPEDSRQTWLIGPDGEIHTLGKCGLATFREVKTINETDVLDVEFEGPPPEKWQIWGRQEAMPER